MTPASRDDAPRQPRSEASHPATRELDALEPGAFVDLLHACDLEVFAGLLRAEFLESLVPFVECLRRAAQSRARVVLAGAGTSGRMAYLVARSAAGGGADIRPWIAGGVRALLDPVEGAEDDVAGAGAELGDLLRSGDVFVGVSCGLSAPCVAAGVLAARARGAARVVLGMNDPASARSIPLPGIPGGFAEALRAVDLCISPDVGSEPLTGSSRMKGGTATFLILDAVQRVSADGGAGIVPHLSAYFEESRRAVESGFRREERAAAVEAVGATLRSRGTVCVLGRGEAGLAAVLDASECPPTFGAPRHQVRAFVEGGWSNYAAWIGEDVARQLAPIDLEAGLEAIAALGGEDCIVLVGEDSDREALRARLPESEAQLVELGAEGLLASKLALNAVSTGAFTRAGKVHGNRMIDVAISNAKLFERAIGIVADLAPCSAERAKASVLAALHERDEVDDALFDLPLSEHLARARPGVVATAILYARGNDLASVRKVLEREPILREALRAD